MRAITIGGAIIDIVVSGVQHEHRIGNKENVDAITLGIGGGAANASFAFRASGMEVTIVCAMGEDAEAQWIRSVLGRAQIDLSLVQCVASQSTGKAVILLDQQGEAQVFAQRGASNQVSPYSALDDTQATLFYVTALSAQGSKDAVDRASGHQSRHGATHLIFVRVFAYFAARRSSLLKRIRNPRAGTQTQRDAA